MGIKSVYATSARFDTARPLSDNDLMKVAPSIFAKSAHESRSAKFQPIPTIIVVNGLREKGFFPVAAKQAKSRDINKREFSKHIVWFRRFDNENEYSVGDNICEILLKNANDGTSLYELMAAMFRIRGLNSLVAQTATIDTVKIRHMNKENVLPQVIDCSYEVLGEAIKLLDAPKEWSQLKLNPEEKLLLAKAAHTIRFNGEDEKTTPIKASQLIIPKRQEDEGDDLWSVWNVAQEHCLKGGDVGFKPIMFHRQEKMRRVTSRPINNIDKYIHYNKALWQMGETFAKQMKRA